MVASGRESSSTRGDGNEPRIGAVKRSRADQRARLLGAIIDAVAQDCYLHAKIGDISQLAGVSRATFYELFAGKEECFVAAQREYGPRISAALAEAIAASDTRTAPGAAVSALVAFAEREPLVFGALTHDAPLAGPRTRHEHRQLLDELAAQLERASDRVPRGEPAPSLPAELLLGGVIRTLNVCIRRGQDTPADLLSGLVEWVDLYGASDGARRWATTVTSTPVDVGAGALALGPIAPRPLPRGRHRLPAPVARRVQRERILHATADVMSTKGYGASTVADIVTAAGLSREVFYSNVSDKREALIEATKLFFEQAMAVFAGAFFTSTGGWPERVWDSGRALSDFLGAAPSFASVVFVESYVPDKASAQRTDSMFQGFSMFLEDGYRHRPEAAQLPRSVSDVVTCSIVELGASYVRRGRATELPSLLPLSTYMILAPFTGVEFAREFVDSRLRETERV